MSEEKKEKPFEEIPRRVWFWCAKRSMRLTEGACKKYWGPECTGEGKSASTKQNQGYPCKRWIERPLKKEE
jgi:hypothetical protein